LDDGGDKRAHHELEERKKVKEREFCSLSE
jgi:hypothetical protein